MFEMSVISGPELEKLGRAAAAQVAGDDAVEQVEVTCGVDSSERPVYFFSFLIDQGRARERAGLVRIRTAQKLRDDLMARGDGHYPMIRVLNKEDWARRSDAGSL